MHRSPVFIDAFQHNNRNNKDMSIAMPMRRPSPHPRRSSLTMNTLAKLISPTSSRSAKKKIAACPELLFKSQSSLLCLGGNSHKKSYDDLMKTGNRSRSGVRFAPTTEFRTIINLRDYTEDEIEACWYSKDELDCLQGMPRASQTKRITTRSSFPSSIRRKRSQCRQPRKPMGGKSRWNA